jgi:hypothetical protein
MFHEATQTGNLIKNPIEIDDSPPQVALVSMSLPRFLTRMTTALW